MYLHWWRRRERRGRPAVSLFLHSPYILQSPALSYQLFRSFLVSLLFELYGKEENQLNQRFRLWRTACIQRLVSLRLVPATDPPVIFLAEGMVFHTHSAEYRRIRIIELHLGGGSHRLKRNASPIESRCKTSKIPNLIGFRITASALLVISS